MTLKEFSDAYEIPYNIVFKLSYDVKPVATIKRSKDFSETELVKKAIEYYDAQSSIARKLLSESEKKKFLTKLTALEREIDYD